MIERIERLVDRLLPNLDRDTKKRAQATDEVVRRSAQERKTSEDAVFAAYRAAGVAVQGPSRGRKWED